jgi:type III secretory pathway component EscR
MTAIDPLHLILAVSLISLVPVVIGMITSFLKVNVVLGMLKSALGIQHAPGVIAEFALSIVITLHVMNPVFHEVVRSVEQENFQSWQNLKPSQIMNRASVMFSPWKSFLLKHSGSKELLMLERLDALRVPKDVPITQEAPSPEGAEFVTEVNSRSLRDLVGAFVLTELREAFLMSFLLLLPFLIIDLIVAHILTGLGMMMMSPVIISLPLKLVLFVAADGWLLLTQSLILSYQ